MSWRQVGLLVVALAVSAAILPAVESLPLNVSQGYAVRSSQVLSYPAHDLAGNSLGSRAWRVVNATGNCCENLVMTTPDGRIMDIGGDQVLITSDDGASWEVAIPLLQVAGEGSMAYAPNGDIVAIVWDPYTGDRMTAMRLPAGSTQWQTASVALHRPFYDRPWLAIAPGPFEVAGTTYPYVTLVYSNYNVGEPTENTLVSLDGLVYIPSDRTHLGGGPQTTFVQPARAWADWVQPAGHTRLTPLPGGGLIATTGCLWQSLGADLMWDCVSPRGPVAALPAIARFDSLGRFHVLNIDTANDVLHYRMSLNGGVSWRTTTIPKLGEINSVDLVVSGQLDQALIALRYAAGGTDHIVVMRLAGLSAAAPAIEVLDAGLGDKVLGSALGGDFRMDFVTIAMLPDGRAVTSFADSLHHPPVMAIEMPR